MLYFLLGVGLTTILCIELWPLAYLHIFLFMWSIISNTAIVVIEKEGPRAENGSSASGGASALQLMISILSLISTVILTKEVWSITNSLSQVALCITAIILISIVPCKFYSNKE